MEKIKDYLLLHLNILLFSFTSVLTKLASIQFNRHGIYDIRLYLCICLMFLNWFIYAIAWQKVIKRFELNVAYANRSVYLIWSQVWAGLIFHENLSVMNIVGMLVVLTGVLVVQKYE